MSTERLDAHDKALLAHLQRDGRASNRELAERTNLSPSPCWRRVKRLEATGVIERYVAVLDPRRLGLHAMAHVHVSLTDHGGKTIDAFDAFVQAEEHIIECCSITGDSDYVLTVVAADAEGLETFLMRGLLALGIVRSSVTHFVLRRTKSSTALPLDSS